MKNTDCMTHPSSTLAESAESGAADEPRSFGAEPSSTLPKAVAVVKDGVFFVLDKVGMVAFFCAIIVLLPLWFPLLVAYVFIDPPYLYAMRNARLRILQTSQPVRRPARRQAPVTLELGDEATPIAAKAAH